MHHLAELGSGQNAIRTLPARLIVLGYAEWCHSTCQRLILLFDWAAQI